MKKLYIVIFLIITLASCSNNKIVFKYSTKPDKTYQFVTNSFSDTELDFIGKSDVVDEIKSSGLTLPLIAQMNQNSLIVYKTGSLKLDSTFPFEVTFEKSISKTILNGSVDTKNGPLTDVVVRGISNEQNILNIDTVISSNITTDMKQYLKTMLMNLQKQIKFPERKLQIGDTFNINLPMEIPIPSMNPIKFTVNTRYKFISIQSEKAIFETIQNLVLDMNSKQMNIDASGQ